MTRMTRVGLRSLQLTPIPLRLVTYNVRYATDTPDPGEEPWSCRCPKICAQLRFISFGQSSVFLCLQEVLYSQLVDIQACLGSDWSHIGRGREDGRQAGEFSPIFFRADAWTLERDATYWLSPTPEVPSRGWDAVLERVVTMGAFRHKHTGTPVIVMSTHFDHIGEVAREQSAELLIKLAQDWADHSDPDGKPALFLGGDLNSNPAGAAYRALTRADSGLQDVSDLLPPSRAYGHRDFTYTSFGESNEQPQKIDFLFVREPNDMTFSSFGILPNRFDDGIFLSDHRPVVADVELRGHPG